MTGFRFQRRIRKISHLEREDGYEIYNFMHVHSAIVLFIEPFGHVLEAVAAPYYVRTY